MKISLSILSYWRIGTGQGCGGALDATCARDENGFPYVPGRQMRGLFREAVTDALALNWFAGDAKSLFGEWPPAELGETDHDTQKGTLRFESAFLPDIDRAALGDNNALIARLFETKRSTAIDRDTGAAKNRSLRFEEVAIPLILEAEIIAFADAPEGWEQMIAKAAPLIRGLGSGRNRGLGRVIVTCESGGGDHA